MKQYLKYIAVAIGGLASTKINTWLLNTYSMNVYLALFISSIVAVIAYKTIEYILIELPLKINYLRLLLEPNAAFEGIWIQTIDKNNIRFYSIINISYNISTKKYMISGEAIDSSGNIHSSWKSENVSMDGTKGEVFYYYKAERYGENIETIYGYGVITFFEIIEKQYFSGSGYFVDSGTQLLQCAYSIDRISKNEIRNLISKNKIYTTNDKIKLILQYDKKYKKTRSINRNFK